MQVKDFFCSSPFFSWSFENHNCWFWKILQDFLFAVSQTRGSIEKEFDYVRENSQNLRRLDHETCKWWMTKFHAGDWIWFWHTATGKNTGQPNFAIRFILGYNCITAAYFWKMLQERVVQGHFCMFGSYESIFIPDQPFFTEQSYRAVSKSYWFLKISCRTNFLWKNILDI